MKVVLALGKALGYLDYDGKIVPEIAEKGRGRWLPVKPTVDPATGTLRIYTNHLAQKLGVKNSSIEVALSRGSFTTPTGRDEINRVYWSVPTANKILEGKNIGDRF